MFQPAYKLTIGKKLIDTTDDPKASTVVDLAVNLDLDTPADRFTLVLGQVGGIQPSPGVEAKIELGYADNGGFTQVITGKVVTVEPGLTTRRVIGYSAASVLLRTFGDRTYESKTAGQIVRDLASRVSVEVATAEDGINFPAYVVNSQCSAYHHMGDLADLCGFDLYINADGKLVFEKFIGGKTVHVFEYAKHILELDFLQSPSRASLVEAWGESPSGRGGAESWAWLTKDFSSLKGTAGEGSAKLLLERPVLRTADAARTAADAALTAIKRRTLRGRLLVLGQPQVKLGDAIRLSNLPDAAFNQSFQVRSVTHRLNKQNGFITAIAFQSIT
jgi:phage protein D